MDDSAFYQITLLPKLAILNLADCHRITWDFNKTEYATYFKYATHNKTYNDISVTWSLEL